MVPTVRTGPIIGLTVQIILLAILAGAVGLGVAGWLTGITYGLITWAALTLGLRRTGVGAFGPADWVTLTRATLVGCAAALTADSFQRPAPPVGVPGSIAVVSIATVALVLDAIDGQVARRTATASGLGARFDMEVDAFLILVLSIYVAQSTGAWVLAIGLMRYAFLAAGWVMPWLRQPVPTRHWRKVVAAIQGIVLVVAAADILPAALMVAALVVALALLVESFGRDIVWLFQRQRLVSAAFDHPM